MIRSFVSHLSEHDMSFDMVILDPQRVGSFIAGEGLWKLKLQKGKIDIAELISEHCKNKPIGKVALKNMKGSSLWLAVYMASHC